MVVPRPLVLGVSPTLPRSLAVAGKMPCLAAIETGLGRIGSTRSWQLRLEPGRETLLRGRPDHPPSFLGWSGLVLLNEGQGRALRSGHQPVLGWGCAGLGHRGLPLLVSSVRHNGVFLHNGHIDQVVEAVGSGQCKTILELGVEASLESILPLRVGIHMVPGVLRQVVEDLRVLGDSARSLGKCQKLVEFPIHQALRDVVASECRAELVPGNHMAIFQERRVVFPP